MNPAIQNRNLADYYFGLLKDMSPDNKLDLIVKLSQSLKESKANEDIPLDSLFGAYKNGETAEELIKNIRESRVFNRNIESF